MEFYGSMESFLYVHAVPYLSSLSALNFFFSCNLWYNLSPITDIKNKITFSSNWVICYCRYLNLLANYPVLTKAVTSAILTLMGDLICQVILQAMATDVSEMCISLPRFTYFGLFLFIYMSWVFVLCIDFHSFDL